MTTDVLTLAAEATAPHTKKLLYYDTAKITKPHIHGTQKKTLAVLHETVSPDLPGLGDILGNENYLAKIDYGIHGMDDKEGHCAWSFGQGDAIFWQAGGVNEESIGIEQVSNIPSLVQAKKITHEQAWHMWMERDKQLEATAKLLACWHNVDPKQHPLVFSDSRKPGVTSHWNVSQFNPSSEGHFDCWPHHLGGYYPILLVIHMAQGYAKLGYHF